MSTPDGHAPRSVPAPVDLLDLAGARLGPTPPSVVDDDAVAAYGASTGDPAASAGDIPPMLLLSLVNLFLPQLLVVEEFSMGVNVGLAGVTFSPGSAPGTGLVATGEVLEAEAKGDGAQVVVRVELHAGDAGGPVVCSADTISRFMP